MEGGKKCLCVVFGLTRRSRVSGGKKKKCYLASCSTSSKSLLVARHILTAGLQNAFKVGSVKFANSLSPPCIVSEELSSTHRK